jgi:hypothetical protein
LKTQRAGFIEWNNSEFQQTEEEDKLSVAAYHLEGEVQMWYQLFKECDDRGADSVGDIEAGLYLRYGPTPFGDHFGDLTKFQQKLSSNLASIKRFRFL